MKYIQNVTPEANNNVKLGSIDPERCRYLFVDSTEHHADRLIVGALIPAKFEPMDKDDTRLRAFEAKEGQREFEQRICSFDSRYESWFLCCMADLEWVLQNDSDYGRACEQLLGAPAVIRAAAAELPGHDKACRNSVVGAKDESCATASCANAAVQDSKHPACLPSGSKEHLAKNLLSAPSVKLLAAPALAGASAGLQ